MSQVDDMVHRAMDICLTCGGIGCKCAELAERSGTQLKDDTLRVIVAPARVDEQSSEDRVWEMLVERGFSPDDWEIVSLTINEWDSPRGHMTMDVLRIQQTKATLKRKIPEDQQPWYRFVQAMAAVGNGPKRTPRPRLVSGKGPITTVLMGDDQAPFVNWSLHEATCEALADIKPNRFIYMGDGCDFDSVSKYPVKHPEWTSTLQEGLDTTHRVLAERMEAAGWPAGDYIPGNHDHRLQEHLLSRSQEVFGLRRANTDEERVLSLSSLLRLSDLGIEYATSELGDYPYPNVEIAPGFIASHGWVVRKGAGASAVASVDRLNASLAIGHTHRLAVGHVTRWNGDDTPTVYTVVETGTMADPRGLGYSKFPDWQSGWATVTVWPDGAYNVDLAHWRNGVLTWRDKKWTLTARGVRAS